MADWGKSDPQHIGLAYVPDCPTKVSVPDLLGCGQEPMRWPSVVFGPCIVLWSVLNRRTLDWDRPNERRILCGLSRNGCCNNTLGGTDDIFDISWTVRPSVLPYHQSFLTCFRAWSRLALASSLLHVHYLVFALSGSDRLSQSSRQPR